MTQLRTYFATLAVTAALIAGFAAGRWTDTAAPCPNVSSKAPQSQQPPSKPTPAPRSERSLIVPVRGVAREGLRDTWGEAREAGGHQGVDIVAPLGADVLAVADGRIAKFFDSERGGVTIYQFDRDERYVFYYAHLSARTVGLAEGDVVRQGEVIGRVGMTGNAVTPHLHFEIQRLTPERLWWRAEAVNAFPFLASGRAPP